MKNNDPTFINCTSISTKYEIIYLYIYFNVYDLFEIILEGFIFIKNVFFMTSYISWIPFRLEKLIKTKNYNTKISIIIKL